MTTPAIDNKPTLAPHLRDVWDCFHELHGDRHTSGMGGVGALPFTAIDRWSVRAGITDPDEFETFNALLRAMDATYLEHLADIAKQRRSKHGDTPANP